LGSVHLFFNTVFKVDKNASTHGIRRETNATQISTGKIENESLNRIRAKTNLKSQSIYLFRSISLSLSFLLDQNLL
jgi:hypothetical protein